MENSGNDSISIDMWYGDPTSDVDRLDASFSDADCTYRGNLYIGGRVVGDYSAPDGLAIEEAFPQLAFDWDRESEGGGGPER